MATYKYTESALNSWWEHRRSAHRRSEHPDLSNFNISAEGTGAAS